jgi:hypothetical protein
MTTKPLLPAFLASILLQPGVAVADEAGKISLYSGFDYSAGDYGSDIRTVIRAVPFVAKYETERWVFKASIPYITITGPGNVIPSVGQIDATPTRKRVSDSGWGDTVATATYTAYQNAPHALVIDLTGKIKFATGDEDKGLSTGENDYAAQVDLYKGFGKFTAIGTLGYRVYGNPKSGPLDNVFYGSVGGSYKLTQQTSTGLLYDYRPKITSTGSEISELMGFVTHKISTNWEAQAYVIGGFSDGSPDVGGGALVNFSF